MWAFPIRLQGSGVTTRCQEDWRRSIAVTGAPLTSQVSGGLPPDAFSASAAPSPGRAKPSSTRAPSSGKAILSAALVVEAMVFGTSLRRCRSGGGRPAVEATSACEGIGTGSGVWPSRA
jgi:hypothetical protein